MKYLLLSLFLVGCLKPVPYQPEPPMVVVVDDVGIPSTPEFDFDAGAESNDQ